MQWEGGSGDAGVASRPQAVKRLGGSKSQSASERWRRRKKGQGKASGEEATEVSVST